LVSDEELIQIISHGTENESAFKLWGEMKTSINDRSSECSKHYGYWLMQWDRLPRMDIITAYVGNLLKEEQERG